MLNSEYTKLSKVTQLKRSELRYRRTSVAPFHFTSYEVKTALL